MEWTKIVVQQVYVCRMERIEAVSVMKTERLTYRGGVDKEFLSCKRMYVAWSGSGFCDEDRAVDIHGWSGQRMFVLQAYVCRMER